MFTSFPHSQTCRIFRHTPLLLGAAALLFGLTSAANAQETVGGGTVSNLL